MSVKRGVIVARIKPGAEEEVARIFAESDETELPRITGVRHRSLYVLDDIYIHLVETDDEFAVGRRGSPRPRAVQGHLAQARPVHPALRPGDLEVAEGRAGP